MGVYEEAMHRGPDGGEALRTSAPGPPGEKKLSPKQEAYLIALACSDPPQGRQHWALRMLADRMVELGTWMSSRTRQCAAR